MMGLAYLTLFIASFAIGWLGTLYEPLGPTAFRALHAAIGASGGVAVLLFGQAIQHVLAANP